jgi:hypothetical protein
MFEWVESVLEWFLDVFKEIFTALWEFTADIGVFLLESVLEVFLLVISFLTLPTFLAAGLGSYVADIDPGVIYFLSKSGLTTGFDLIGMGVMFRLSRKLLTLGQW